ncbi:MAG: BrnT family toxin [Candidatus Poribacteria bacterium]|nr:BrnT family toxin [Candidatus Poribacteria bacterium]
MPYFDELDFEWDEVKAAANKQKYGVAFGVAVYVFADTFHIERLDERDYGNEYRYLATGLVGTRILTVIYADYGGVYRIISARGATPKERRLYYGNREV